MRASSSHFPTEIFSSERAAADVYIVSDAEGTAGTPRVFASFDDDHASGIAYAPALHEIFVATMHHVWSIPYDGERTAARVTRIADVRAGPVAPGTDGDVHVTTSVAYTGGLVYVAVGSSCNATMGGGQPCVEVDPTRAAVSVMKPDGSAFAVRAKRIRNAIALAVNPATGSLWVGDAGQDDLPSGHPYEFLDDLSVRRGVADYGWPECEENHRSYVAGSNCANAAEPLVELPAYSTIIGAAFYPANQGGRYAFPKTYRGGLFVTAHGSWHINAAGCSAAPARVAFVAMNGDRPAKSADWSNPTAAMERLRNRFSARMHRAHRAPYRHHRRGAGLAFHRGRCERIDLPGASRPWLTRSRSSSAEGPRRESTA